MGLKINFTDVNNWFTIRRTKILFMVYTIVLVLLAVLPINSTGSVINNTYLISIRLDYILHFVTILPWMFLLWKTGGVSFSSNLYQAFLYIIIGLIFALATETIQYFLPYRAFNINDILANCLGVVLGSLFFLL